MVQVLCEDAIRVKAGHRAATLADLTRMYWSAAILFRRGRPSPHIEPTLWHVLWKTTGALHERVDETLKEVLK